MVTISKVSLVASLILLTVVSATQNKITKTFHSNGKIESITYAIAITLLRGNYTIRTEEFRRNII